MTRLIQGAGAASATVNTAAPTLTTSTTMVMAGCGALIVPQASGFVFCHINGTIATSASGDGGKVSIAFGQATTAPTNGSGPTGTLIGATVTYASLVTTELSQPVALAAISTALTLGLPYWFDLQFAAITGGNCTLTTIAVSVFEVG